MITVVCVKSKPAYDFHYVNRLYRMVKRNFPVPHKFLCLTDDPSGVVCQTKSLPKGIRGWWAKLAMFKQCNGKTIYFDLDTLITGDISFLADYNGSFAILRDFYRPEGYGSGMMLWNKGHEYIWNNWLKAGTPNHPLGDQGWMEQQVKDADRVQDLYPGKIVSFKEHCQDGLPRDARIVCFHGVPKPHDFEDSHWVTKTWRS